PVAAALRRLTAIHVGEAESMVARQPVVEVRGLTKRYGARTVVDDVSFEVNRGEVFALIGPNGCGKTSTIRMLCGLLKPTSGAASVLGYDVVRDTERLKQQIGYMS